MGSGKRSNKDKEEEKVKSLAELKDLMKPENEAAAWKIIQDLRQSFEPGLFNRVRVNSREDALKSGIAIIRDILAALKSMGIDLRQIAPGHGIGHIVKDYVHSLRLISKLELHRAHLLVGSVGGTFHDVGCALVPRYQEHQRAIRHAEAGAILLWEILRDAFFDGPERPEPLLIAWAVAAHTHYLRPAQVKCEDGITRQIQPYQDEVSGQPIHGIWLPRWVDRLDCVGPTHVGRHFLTLIEEHKDYSFDAGHFPVKFKNHMRPLLRSKEEIQEAGDGQTMLEHLRMYAESQTNQSPYGKHDQGVMVTLRNAQKERSLRIIGAVRDEQTTLTVKERDTILWAWARFLQHNIEPTALARDVSQKLETMFRQQLDEQTQTAWCRGFKQTMEEYQAWADDTLKFLETVDPSWLNFSPIVDDVSEIIRP